jgi:hypothetical protein
MPPKVCPPDKILNPHTGMCVKKDGVVGKQLLSGTYQVKIPQSSLPVVKKLIPMKVKYPHVVDWIKNELIYGDTKAFFMALIDKDAVQSAIIQVSEIIVPQLTKIFNKSQIGHSNQTFSEVQDLILLSCPWPGFIKKPQTLTHLEDYSNNQNGSVFDEEVLFKAYLLDVPSQHSTVLDLMKLYYDDPDYGS